MIEVKEIINSWRDALLAPADNDVLVNLNKERKDALLLYEGKNKIWADIPDQIRIRRILKVSRDFRRESGIESLGVSSSIIHFTYQGKNYSSPVFLASAKLNYDRFSEKYQVIRLDEFLLNPFLQQIFGIEEDANDIGQFQGFLDELNLSYTIEPISYLANFHPFRFALVKELENLAMLTEIPENVSQLIGFGEGRKDEDFIKLSNGCLFPSNNTQNKVFEAVEEENIVVQGPPGTGKSQVIANLIGKALGGSKRVLLVSEKKVALGVILDKLRQANLDEFCMVLHEQGKSATLINSLESCWRTLENTDKCSTNFMMKSQFMIDGMNLTLSRLNQPNMIGGLSFSEFRNSYSRPQNVVNELANPPKFAVWEKDKISLLELTSIFTNKRFWKLVNYQNFDSANALKSVLLELNELTEKLNLESINLEELDHRIRQSFAASYFFYDDIPLNEELFRSLKVRNEFIKFTKQLQLLLDKLKILEDERKNWKDDVSLSQLSSFLEILTKNDRFSLSFWQTKSAINKLKHFQVVDAQSAIERFIELKKLEQKIVDLKSKIRDLGVDPDPIVLQQIALLLNKLSTLETNLVQELSNHSPSQRFALYKQSNDLNRVKNIIAKLFTLSRGINFSDVVDELLKNFNLINDNYKRLALIHPESRNTFAHFSTIEKCEEAIIAQHWREFNSLYPELASLTSETMQMRVNDIIQQEDEEFVDFSNSLFERIRAKFESYHQLLQTPARQLNQEQKELKAKLRSGKSILVKEFSKSRNHKSIHQLLNSEAELWIALLKPIVMATPYAVAKSLPLKTRSYDFVIFDEASQLPLHHAAGALARGKRIVVAGDSQQMEPSFFFKKNNNVSYADILHHASFYWRNSWLLNHYRSFQPELIAFSNKYFYHDRLLAYPKANQEEVVEVVNINGKFINRVNEQEARYVADLIEKKLKSGERDFGLVAFSQKQLDTILDFLDKKVKEELLEYDGDGFFIRSLENVQGEECEHLIISLGYGFDENNRFLKHFGPINRNGGHKRLNVLMSRARKRITFVKSVMHTDFQITDNEGVEMLRKLITFLDTTDVKPRHKVMRFGNFNIETEGNTLSMTLTDASKESIDAVAVLDAFRVFRSRGWEVKFRF
jgi:hypothetical protein